FLPPIERWRRAWSSRRQTGRSVPATGCTPVARPGTPAPPTTTRAAPRAKRAAARLPQAPRARGQWACRRRSRLAPLGPTNGRRVLGPILGGGFGARSAVESPGAGWCVAGGLLGVTGGPFVSGVSGASGVRSGWSFGAVEFPNPEDNAHL